MKLLVLGKSGQIGSDLVNLLKNSDLQFTALDRKSLDLSKIENLESQLSDYDFDILINCAAYTKVDLAETEAQLATKINAVAVGEIAKVCNKKSAKLIHISTDYVFAGDKNSPYFETDETNPQSVYGMSKLQGEELATSLNFKTWVLRTAWVYGEFGNNFPKTIGALLEQSKNLDVVDDQFGAPTWSLNIAQAILNLIEISPEYGIYNCTSSGETTWYKFAQEIAASLSVSRDKVKPIKSSMSNRAAARPNYSVLSNEKWVNAGLNPLPHWLDAWQKAQNSVLKNS